VKACPQDPLVRGYWL